jgi:hypothetical protein
LWGLILFRFAPSLFEDVRKMWKIKKELRDYVDWKDWKDWKDCFKDAAKKYNNPQG